ASKKLRCSVASGDPPAITHWRAFSMVKAKAVDAPAHARSSGMLGCAGKRKRRLTRHNTSSVENKACRRIEGQVRSVTQESKYKLFNFVTMCGLPPARTRKRKPQCKTSTRF